MVERPHALDGPVGELLREGAVTVVEPGRLRPQRAIGERAVLEHAPQHRERGAAGGAHLRPRRHAVVLHPAAALRLHLERLEAAVLADTGAPDGDAPPLELRPRADVRAQGAHDADELLGGSPEIEPAVVADRSSPRRSARPPAAGRPAPDRRARTSSRRTATSAARAKTSSASSSEPIGNARLRGDRAGVQRLDRLVDRHAGLRIPGHDRALHRRRPAPARQQRRMDVEPRSARRAAPQGSRARTRTRRPSARRGRAPRAGRSGCRTGIPSPSATTFAGGAASRRPRPAGASGRVRSAATSCVRGEPLEDVGAERRGRGDRDPGHA